MFTCVIKDYELTRMYNENIFSIMCDLYLATNTFDVAIPPATLEVRMWSSTDIKTSNLSTTVNATRDPQIISLPCGHLFVQIQYYLCDKGNVSIKLVAHVDKTTKQGIESSVPINGSSLTTNHSKM